MIIFQAKLNKKNFKHFNMKQKTKRNKRKIHPFKLLKKNLQKINPTKAVVKILQIQIQRKMVEELRK
jgi:hypothetical protein